VSDLSQIKGILDAALSLAQQRGDISDYYYGNHGTPGQVYQGEAGGFDESGPSPTGWKVTQKWLEAGSELAILILQIRRGRITPGPRLHFNDEIHFFCNQLGKAEATGRHFSIGVVHCTSAGD
jgi:hypothetical protein